MIPSAAVVQLATVAGALASACTGFVVVFRARAAGSPNQTAFRNAASREAVLVDAARRLACAARASVDAVRDEIVRAARAVAPDIDGVLVYEEDEGALRCVVASGSRFAYFDGTRVALDDPCSLPSRALAAGHRITLADAEATKLHPGDFAAVAIPFAREAGRACVLAVASQRAIETETIDRLVMLADQAAPAYLIALDRELDRRRAEYDGLTGLLTPRALRQRLAVLVDRARLQPAARLALLFVDTDHFKCWNDRYGHAAGDALLREIAHVLRSAAHRADDLVARNGGDEFCVVFTETDKSTAIERADTLRRRIAALDVARLRPADAEGSVQITASIGVAAFAADASTASDLLERADAAMYHTKETGRDGVSYAAPDRSLARLSMCPPVAEMLRPV